MDRTSKVAETSELEYDSEDVVGEPREVFTHEHIGELLLQKGNGGFERCRQGRQRASDPL